MPHPDGGAEARLRVANHVEAGRLVEPLGGTGGYF
jgi:hypothetical protein